MRRPQLHPACKIFPPLHEDELQGLADDIAQNGLRNPIVMLDRKILDGRNRFEACKLAGVEPEFVEFDGNDPIGWVVSQNLVRRHLTPSQRAVVAFDLLPLLEKEAKLRQQESNGRGKKVRKNSVPFSKNGEAAEIAAGITGSNAKYVRSVKQIKERAPELIEKIRSGELSIPDAKRIADADPAVLEKLPSFDEKAILQFAKEIRKQQTMARNERQIAAEQKTRASLPKRKARKITGDQKVVKCDLVIADSPYGITRESWEPDDLEAFTRGWCKRWSKCGADFIAVFWSQEKLFQGRLWFDESLTGYRFQQLLVWHANNNCGPKDRQWLKQTW